MKLSWLKFQPRNTEQSPNKTDGAAIQAIDPGQSLRLELEQGSCLALMGPDVFRKHYFCDWLLGFVETPGSQVHIEARGQLLSDARARTETAAILGRLPQLYGETIQEALLYRTRNVRKQDLHQLIEQLYGPGLRERTSPQNPLCGPTGLPVSTQSLTAREHLEIAQINVLLQDAPLLVVDLSSKLMSDALKEGYRPAAALFEGGKTVLAILPPDRDCKWGEAKLGRRFTASITF